MLMRLALFKHTNYNNWYINIPIFISINILYNFSLNLLLLLSNVENKDKLLDKHIE